MPRKNDVIDEIIQEAHELSVQVDKIESGRAEAVQAMFTAVERISTPDEFKSLKNRKNDARMDVGTLAKGFTILANRIADSAPELQKKAQKTQSRAANPPKKA